ncbi:MAG: hypothetical protein KAF27_11885 [Porphyrobacter sp.]|nr:hypothetical protein [Porphyrobacter sp.]
MSGLGFGYRLSRRAAFRSGGASVASEIAQFGVSFNFAAPRPVGQYANGDWWVLGPVTITSITPDSSIHIGTDGNGVAYTNRVVHGAMLNPGNRAYASGGLASNNTGNTLQSFDTLANGVSNMVYNAAHNVDPGATGQSLVVNSGSVMKFVSRLTGLATNNRPAGLDMVVLTVVDAIPASDAIRPGVSRAGSKTSPCRLSDFNLAVFQSLAPTPNAPSYAQALDWVDRYIEAAYPDSINNTGTKGFNNHPEYGRDIGNNLHRALLCLHLSSFTSEQKRTLLSHLAAIADDLVARAEEGSVTLGAGGGNSWKLPTIAVCAAALGAKTPASWLTYLSAAQRSIWAENRQIFRVSGADIALPRFTADGRPRTPYTQQMIGSAEWGEQPLTSAAHSGSNWNASYRDVVAYSLFPGVLALELTTGGKALWNYPEFWLYMDTVFLRRAEGSAGNNLIAFALEMVNAYRPAKTAAPVILDAGIKGGAVWVRFDQALNEIAAAPPTSSFTVNVNGAPVAISSVSIWRQNLGLALPAPVTGNDIVTLSYTAASNPVRSVDGVNIANLSSYTLTNRTDKVGGPNAAFPVVRFGSGVVRTLGGTGRLGTANTQVGTGALLKFKFAALPAAQCRIFGFSGGIPVLSMFMNTDGRFEVRLLNSAGVIAARFFTPALAPNVEYDILWSVDMTQTTGTAAINCFINGAQQTLNISTFTSGATLGWNNSAVYRWNDTNNMVFEFGAFWLDPTVRVDLTSSANRSKFTDLTGGNLNILTRGDGITGTIPQHFHVGDADQWNDSSGINRGSGNKLFVTSGLVTPISGSTWV